MKNTHVVAAKHATSNILHRAAWSGLQSQAKHLGITVDVLLREQGHQSTERIRLKLPTAFVSLLERELALTSPSQFERILASALLTLDLETFCEQFTDLVHRNRNAAYRAAVAVFVRDHSRRAIALRYRCRGHVQTEIFSNPLAAIRAA